MIGREASRVIRLFDLFSEEALESAIAERHVSRKQHPDLPLAILNYTDMATFAKAWTPVTRQCRGLIFDTESLEVVARPWAKFYNYGEHATAPEGSHASPLDHDGPVEVTDKQDGSLGILVPHGYGEPFLATRGSFISDQAQHATALYRERYVDAWDPDPHFTYLFEIVYPENRIVLNYGDLDDLVLLGAQVTDQHVAHGPDDLPLDGWPGPRTKVFPYPTLRDALTAEPRPNAEGVVVRFKHAIPPVLVKIKQEDYVALHRIVTNSSARTLWEYLAVDACRDLVHEAKHWGSFLGIDPARAEEIINAGEGWRERMLNGVPDEFYAWVEKTLEDLTDQAAGIEFEARAVLHKIKAEHIDRASAFAAVRDHVFQRPMMNLWAGREDDGSMKMLAWRTIQPSGLDRPFSRGEDVA